MTPKEHEINLKSHELWAERGRHMFTTPIRHTSLKSMEELFKFSYPTEHKAKKPYVFWQNNGQIAFSDKLGMIWVTPYRTEIHSILNEEGYSESAIFVPFSNGEEYPEAYAWLKDIAEQEKRAMTHEEAFEKATERGIKSVSIKAKVQVKEIIGWYEDEESNARYEPMTMMYLMNNTRENIATYIVVDEKTLLICDEYGRTFLVKVKTVINDIVNALIEAGYTRTAHPERYIHFHETQVSED